MTALLFVNAFYAIILVTVRTAGKQQQKFLKDFKTKRC